jgi:hypothetical protein
MYLQWEASEIIVDIDICQDKYFVIGNVIVYVQE